MQGSINFDGSLVGNITGGGGGGGDTVVITPVVTSGTKIADVSVNGVEKDLYCPTPTAVSVTQVQQSGTKIATIGVNGVNTDIYTPEGGGSDVEITPVVTSGTKIADVSVGGVEKDLYTPDYGADITEIKQSLSDFETLEKTASGAIATFDDGSDLPMPSLKVAIEPVQSGSGDPSPTNVRPISGWNEVNVTVADDVETPTVSNVYTIDLDGTRYGGTLDVVSGVLTVDRVSVDLGTLNWSYASAQKVFYDNLPTNALNVINKNGLCEGYIPTAQQSMDAGTWARISEGEFVFAQNLKTNGRCAVVLKNLNYTIATEFKSSVNGMKMLYPLATPQSIQLTPTQVKSLLGQNNVWADTGNIELTYLTNNPLTQTVYDMVKILVEQST